MMSIENVQTEGNQAGPISTKTIILWGPDGLLTWYMNYLLDGQSNWKVIRLFDEMGATQLLVEIEKLHPSVVIIYQEQDYRPTHLSQQILTKFPTLKVITVNLENNFLEVQNQQRIRIRDLSDFLTILES
jgi:hypothetical protein